jgi:hypothetical protein
LLTTCFKYFLVKFFYSIKEKNRNGKPSNFQIMQTILLLALLGYAVYSTPPHSLTMGTSCNWYVLSASKFHFCFKYFNYFLDLKLDIHLKQSNTTKSVFIQINPKCIGIFNTCLLMKINLSINFTNLYWLEHVLFLFRSQGEELYWGFTVLVLNFVLSIMGCDYDTHASDKRCNFKFIHSSILQWII